MVQVFLYYHYYFTLILIFKVQHYMYSIFPLDMDLKDQVDASLSLPASYNTVVVRAQLAQQFCELARDQTRICERLVHDQHLQQQGEISVNMHLSLVYGNLMMILINFCSLVYFRLGSSCCKSGRQCVCLSQSG